MDKDIRPRKAMGGSGVERVKSDGSSGIEYLFYFLPDTNGRAYVVMVRHKNYSLYSQCSVRVMNENTGYNEVRYNENSIDSYLHRFEFDGLETNETYTIRMSWITEIEAFYQDIERTYYCNNDTPTCYPYSDARGRTTIQSYDSAYPEYCLRIECEENKNNLDDRCPYDAETRNLFWRVCATNYETHPIASAMEPQVTARWPSGTVYVDVTYKNSTNKEEISARIDEWIDWMNGLVADAGVTFVLGSSTEDNARQISVVVGTHKQLWGYNPDTSTTETYIYGGTWESILWEDGIIEARVKICCEDRYPFDYCTPKFQGIVFEELTEASGPRYDQFGLNNTVFSEFSYPSKTIGGPEGESWKRDENVIKILYSLGYLKGETSPYYEYDSEYGSGITFNKYYDSYGPLSSSDADLFFQINATEGSITTGETPETQMSLAYKSKRTYSISTLYATKIPLSREEETSGKTDFYYTNPSEKSYPYFDLPNKPNCASSIKVGKGYRFEVSGLSASGEYYNIQAFLTNITDQDVDNDTYSGYAYATHSKSSVSITDLQYGKAYKFYLYSDYNNIESDWIYIGEGTVAPMKPIVSGFSHNDSEISFSYDMDGTVFGQVVYELYRDGVLIESGSNTQNSDETSIYYGGETGSYELKVYSIVTANGTDIQCVDSEGNADFETYSFRIANRAYFYWSDAVAAGGAIENVSYTEWNAFVQNVCDTVCTFAGKSGNMPSNSSVYASGFGLAAGKTYLEALSNYAKMSAMGTTLTAERFNIVNYIINRCVTTGIAYKYSKTTQPMQVLANELITMQDKLNSI